METLLHITKKKANAAITSEFLLRGNNIDRFRVSYGRLRRKVLNDDTITSIRVHRKCIPLEDEPVIFSDTSGMTFIPLSECPSTL